MMTSNNEAMHDVNFSVYDLHTYEKIKEFKIGNIISLDDGYYEFIGIVDDDDDIPLDKNIIYLRESDNRFYRKKATPPEVLAEFMPKSNKIEKILTPDDVIANEKINCVISDKDNYLAVLIKQYFKEMGITKADFKNIFKDKPSEVSNTMKKIEDGSLSWNRFIDILQRFGCKFTLYLESDDYELVKKEQDVFYVIKKDSHPYAYQIYTDGGFNHETLDASYGFTIYKTDLKEPNSEPQLLGSESGILVNVKNGESEIAAILKALEYLNRFQICNNDTVELISDSKQIIMALIKYVDIWKERGWKKMNSGAEVSYKDYYIKILNITEKLPVQIKWTWVQGHSGHKLNNEVDRMCRKIIHR